jgi:hypothetical protein
LPPIRTDREQRADRAVAGAEDVLEKADETVPGVGISHRPLGQGLPLGVPVTEQFLDESFLGEVAVQRGVADPGAPRSQPLPEQPIGSELGRTAVHG